MRRRRRHGKSGRRGKEVEELIYLGNFHSRITGAQSLDDGLTRVQVEVLVEEGDTQEVFSLVLEEDLAKRSDGWAQFLEGVLCLEKESERVSERVSE